MSERKRRMHESIWRRVNEDSEVNFRMMARIIALIGYDLSFL